MKTVAYLFVFAVLTAISNFSGFVNSSSAKNADSVPYVQGELLVKYRDVGGRSAVAELHRQLGAQVRKDFASIRWQHVELPQGIPVEAAMARYAGDPNVEVVQPNFIYHLTAEPDDPRYADLYGMQKIAAPLAWNTTTGSDSVVVAIIDTGINYEHEDLMANVWSNPLEIAANGVDDDQNGYVDDLHGIDTVFLDSDPADDHSHGSHCAGTIGGVGNNGKGVAGVNWNVKMMAVKTHDGVAGASTSTRVITAYQYVTMMKNRGVNIKATSNSYGGAPEAAAYDPALKDAIDEAGRADILNVFAAGNVLTVGAAEANNDLVPTYPGSYNSPSILTVAASDRNDNMASFSHYGATSVDVAAPGVGILSTVLGQDYGSKSGTSMATPHVAGAAALLAAAQPYISAASIRATLMNSVDVLPQWGGLTVTGGRINIANAIANPTICTYSISSKAMSFQAIGGSGSFDVTSGNNCGFSGYSDQPWVAITSDPSSGYGTVQYTVLPNTGLEPRTATVFTGGKLYTITQAGPGPAVLTATIAGRVMTPDGKGINKAVVRITDAAGVSRQVTTSSTGFYRIDNVASGRNYAMSAEYKRYEFEDRSVVVIGNADNVDFVGKSR
jgi:thermitase